MTFLFEATDVQNAALPSAVLATVQSQFPGYSIEPGNSERYDFPDGSVQYHVELEHSTAPDLDVVLQANGTIVCTDTSDDDNDDDSDDDSDDDNDDNNSGGSNNAEPSNIPADALDFINSNFAGYDVQDVNDDDLCNDVPVYEVELENGPGPDIDLYFDLSWNFLFEATDVQNAALPSAVLATVQSQFPGYSI
ncbi:MAG: PepSY-like domain-containing protein, partial [Saprospiraceae bacterium]|nr:PepSY-like domain-containing protein [Saprospiraceae bacterium]